MASSRVLIFVVIGHNTINIPNIFQVFTFSRSHCNYIDFTILLEDGLSTRYSIVWTAKAHNWDKPLTHKKHRARQLADKGWGRTKSQSPLLNIYFRLSWFTPTLHFLTPTYSLLLWSKNLFSFLFLFKGYVHTIPFAFVQPGIFLAGNRAGFCDLSARFLVNCFEKIVMEMKQQIEFNLFAYKWRATGTKKKRKAESKN